MKRLLPALLLLLAVLAGLFLPELQVRLRERQDSQPEAAGIEAVELLISSDLSLIDKISVFGDDQASATPVADGQNQTTESISRLGRSYLSGLSELNMWEDSLAQESSEPYLVTADADIFLCWRLSYNADEGGRLVLWLDDETGCVLSFVLYYAYTAEGMAEEPAEVPAEVPTEEYSDVWPAEIAEIADYYAMSMGLGWEESDMWESGDAAGGVAFYVTLLSAEQKTQVLFWIDNLGAYLNEPQFRY